VTNTPNWVSKIDESIVAHIGEPDRLYSWISVMARPLARERARTRLGAATGQRLFVMLALELAAVVTAGHYGEPMQAWLPLVIFNLYVLPAVK
jgi:hypothetical protein